MSLNRLRLVAATLVLAMPFVPAAHAQESSQRPKGVVELFTSQGCTSCPPADEMLGEMVAKGDVVALAYHVDYWDYLGWRDTLASSENTARQQEYSKVFGKRSVYTPQAVVNGRAPLNAAKRAKVHGALEGMSRGGDGLTVDVSISYQDDIMVVETGAASQPVGDAQIVVVYYEPATRVDIARGRNSGRQFTYRNSVLGFHSAGMWTGGETRIELPVGEFVKKGAGGCAVLLQQMAPGGLPGPILGAAILEYQQDY